VETIFSSLALGFSVAFQPGVLWYAFIGCLVGTLVGMLPGIGPLAGISILLPVTYGLDPTKAIIMLAGIYYGSQYGGSTTSILLRIPGEAASVMTCIDGYAMAQKGRAGAALCIAAVGSFIAGTLSVIALTFVAPPLAAFALRFGPPEYTALLVMGLIFLAYMSSTSLLRTLLMALLGLMLGTIGIDVMTGHFRYSFDIKELGDGIGIVPVAVGLFGLGEILSKASADVQGKLIRPRCPIARNGSNRWRQSGAARCWAFSSASCRDRRTSSQVFSLMPSRNGSRKIQTSLARARSRAWPDRNRPTMRHRQERSCRC
jgi:putative tricarboxylic transport membrane protein